MDAARYRATAEDAWRWVLGQVRDDDGPWLPSSVDGAEPLVPAHEDRDTVYLGAGGLALALAELRLTRPLRDEELALADALTGSLVRSAATRHAASLYFGLAGDACALRALGHPAHAGAVLDRVATLETPAGWTLEVHDDGAVAPVYDVVAGAAGVALAAVWCGDREALARRAAEHLVAVADVGAGTLDWPMYEGQLVRLPNFSHGTAGIAAALAVTGRALGDASLVAAATRGAERILELADLADGGLVVPHRVPDDGGDEEAVTYSWCHGPTGTVLLFSALEHAGVETVGGRACAALRRRCLRSLVTSGIPERLRPGFWDNDGRCCGTAGAGDALLDAAQRDAGDAEDAATWLAAAVRMGDALVERAVVDGDGARWRFLEHRLDEPLLWPSTGWSQGAAGIAAFLWRLARVLDEGPGALVADRADQWWAVPAALRTVHAGDGSVHSR